MMKRERVKCLFILLLLMTLPSVSSSDFEYGQAQDITFYPACHENPVVITELEYEDYRLEISSAGDQMCQTLDIFKSGVLVYHDEEIGGYFYLGDDSEEDEAGEPVLRLTDREEMNLVISKWSGGAHCCYSLSIFELGQEFKTLAHIEGGNSQPYLEDLDTDGLPEIKLVDDFLAYRFSCYADSAVADVVLAYRDGAYHVAADYMRKIAPDSWLLDKRIPLWQKEFRENRVRDEPPPGFVQTVTDLVYTGHKNRALDLIDRVWPVDIPGKDKFVEDYEIALKESQFYGDFEKQL